MIRGCKFPKWRHVGKLERIFCYRLTKESSTTKNFCCCGKLTSVPIFISLYMTTQGLIWKVRMRLSETQSFYLRSRTWQPLLKLYESQKVLRANRELLRWNDRVMYRSEKIYLSYSLQWYHSNVWNISTRAVHDITQWLTRGGVRTIPACNAVRRGLLHIIDFSLCAVIVRSAFVVFTPRDFERFRKYIFIEKKL